MLLLTSIFKEMQNINQKAHRVLDIPQSRHVCSASVSFHVFKKGLQYFFNAILKSIFGIYFREKNFCQL